MHPSCSLHAGEKYGPVLLPVQRLIGHHTFQAGVLTLQILQAFRLIQTQTAVGSYV